MKPLQVTLIHYLFMTLIALLLGLVGLDRMASPTAAQSPLTDCEARCSQVQAAFELQCLADCQASAPSSQITPTTVVEPTILPPTPTPIATATPPALPQTGGTAPVVLSWTFWAGVVVLVLVLLGLFAGIQLQKRRSDSGVRRSD